MPRRIYWVVAGVIVVWLAFTIWANIKLFAPRMVSSAVSPDGSWSVAVVGKREWSGGYELVAEVRDRNGLLAPTGEFVVGLSHDLLLAAEQNVPVSFVDADTARIGKRTLEKSQYFKP